MIPAFPHQVFAPWLWRTRAAPVVAGTLLLLGAALWLGFRGSPDALVRQARQALARRDLDRAGELAEAALSRAPRSGFALITAGEIAAERGDVARAIAHYEKVTGSDARDHVVALGATADLLIQQGRLHDAERRLQKLLEIDAGHVVGLRRLAGIQVISGKRRESAEPLLHLVRLGKHDLDELALLGNLEQLFDNREAIDRFRQKVPDDPLVLLAAARNLLLTHEPTQALLLLQDLVRGEPLLMEARVQLGYALYETAADREFVAWHAALPPDADAHPDIWLLRGLYARRAEQTDAAVRCFWEAARRDPNLWQAHALLGQLLAARSDSRAGLFLCRANLLRDLAETLKTVLADGATIDDMLRAARIADALARPWEAWAWYRAAAAHSPGDSATVRERDRLESMLGADTPQTLPAGNPALTVDLSDLRVPIWPSRGEAGGARPGGAAGPAVRFDDAAPVAGIVFSYNNGDDPDESGMRLWQTFGGGVAALDFDGDGWCDLHFTQGGSGPPGDVGQCDVDRLFRNLGTGAFADITELAGVGDDGYSHGVTAGDFDDDGFPDLYVANIGDNRLYRNNGDGTFRDVTQAAGVLGAGWTTSCVFVDLNGDGFPELFDVNYLAGRAPFTEVCWNRELDAPRSCLPNHFEAEQDRLFLNRGDGTFEDVSAAAGIQAPDGKGLGVAAFLLSAGQFPSLFVANDTTPNFLFVNVTSTRGAAPRFQESGIAAGCAYSAQGRATASMGVAVGDADGDGLLDLFVTTFHKEYNILFRQRPGGMFVDVSNHAGLMEPSVAMLGFGTQFLDADLDGWPDLVVFNGHVDDFSGMGIPFRMRPQFFSNRGSGQFVERRPSELGEFFGREQLGRGLARIDWNRDGREDLAVSHLDTPAALVTNRTTPAGHYLAVSLRGVDSSRDAIGATVIVRCGGIERQRQLTAGDGYCCSNQRQLVFGLAECVELEDVIVHWPSGRTQHLGSLAVDREWLVVEGRPRAAELPRN